MLTVRGFTIVEIMVVVIVIGLLASVATLQFRNVLADSRDTERKTDISSVSTQIEQYFSRTGGYPSNSDLNNSTFRTGNRIASGDSANWFSDPSNRTTTTLSTESLPTDSYSYLPSPTGCSSPTDNSGSQNGTTNPCRAYTLIAKLENSTDIDRDSALSTETTSYYVKRNAAN